MTRTRSGRSLSPAWILVATVLVNGAEVKAQEASTPTHQSPSSAQMKARRPVRSKVLDLEDATARAELILVVRLVEVTESKVVHGGKIEVVTQQFRFEPVRTMKGIFARDSILLTGQDLGSHRFAAGADRLERGQMLLLLLGRQGPGYFNCNTAESLEQSIPRLRNQADPLLAAVETLIAVTQKRDRDDKVATLLAALRKAEDRDAAPLLLSLSRRALLGAQTPDVMEVVGRFLGAPSPEVRVVAAKVMGTLLEASAIPSPAVQEQAARLLVAALDADPRPHLELRIAALNALGATGGAAHRVEPARNWLRVNRPATTYAEHAARLRAIGRTEQEDQREPLAAYFEQLPLDAPGEVQVAAGNALGRLDPQEATRRIEARLTSKSDAGLAITDEITLLGSLPRDEAVPILVTASDMGRLESQAERLAFAQACAKLADGRLAPALGEWLDPQYGSIAWLAADALRQIDTDEAARLLWPRLSEEADLPRKLQLAAFLGRHGFRGGYAIAIEHMSIPQLRDAAVEALAAIREPKAVPELRKIWEGSNDTAWNAAAIRALALLGLADIEPRLIELAGDRHNPLAASALIALGDLQAVKALPLILSALESRSDEVVIAATRAAGKLPVGLEDGQSAKLSERLGELVADADASLPVREAALESLVARNDSHLDAAIRATVRDGALEGSELLRRIETLVAARKVKLAPDANPHIDKP